MKKSRRLYRAISEADCLIEGYKRTEVAEEHGVSLDTVTRDVNYLFYYYPEKAILAKKALQKRKKD